VSISRIRYRVLLERGRQAQIDLEIESFVFLVCFVVKLLTCVVSFVCFVVKLLTGSLLQSLPPVMLARSPTVTGFTGGRMR
jgi:hypothetical protein